MYSGATTRLQKLERRSTDYRFDLERDPGWERSDEPGVHLPPGLLADLGVDVDTVAPYAETFDWVYGASVSRAFVVLEECVVEFIERERERILPTSSLESLLEEEAKHIAMFHRYEEQLLAKRDRASFDRWFAPMGARIRDRHGEKVWSNQDPAARHWSFWVHTTFFEEYTLYLDARLQAADGIQPTWRQLHRLHRIEEIQHVATDEGYLEALGLDEAKVLELSKVFSVGILQNLKDTLGLAAPLAAVQELGGVSAVKPGGVSKLPFVRDVLTRPEFRRTRAYAPYLQELARKGA